MSEEEGVIHNDPVAMVLLVYMAFILIFWLSQSSSLNPIGTNSTFTNAYSQAYSNTKWFLALFAPLGAYMIFNGVRTRLDEEEGYEEI